MESRAATMRALQATIEATLESFEVRYSAKNDQAAIPNLRPARPRAGLGSALRIKSASQRMTELQTDGNPLEGWWSFLNLQLDSLKGPCQHLLRFYKTGIERIDQERYRDQELYVQLWLEYARLAMACGDAEEAGFTFQQMQQDSIGRGFRHFHTIWAEFEESQGHTGRSLEILRKGRTARKPSSEIVARESRFKCLLETPTSCIRCGGRSKRYNNDQSTDPTPMKRPAPTRQATRRQAASRAAAFGPPQRVPLSTSIVEEEDDDEDKANAKEQARPHNHSRSSKESEALMNDDLGLPSVDPVKARLAQALSANTSAANLSSDSNLPHLTTSSLGSNGSRLSISSVGSADDATNNGSGSDNSFSDIQPGRHARDPERRTGANRPSGLQHCDAPVDRPHSSPRAPLEAPMPAPAPHSAAAGAPKRQHATLTVRPDVDEDPLPPPLPMASTSKQATAVSSPGKGQAHGPTTAAPGPTGDTVKFSLKSRVHEVQARDELPIATPMGVPRPKSRHQTALPAPSTVEAAPPVARRMASAAATPSAAPASMRHQPVSDEFVRNMETVSVAQRPYIKLEQLGKGGSSRVYRVLDAEHAMLALKEVDLRDVDAATVASFKNEIHLLERLQGEPNIICLVDWEHDEVAKVLRIVMECGDVDLARMLQTQRAARASSRGAELPVIDENHIRLYFQQMLEAVGAVHRQQIVHSDLKPANFLCVKGALKLIDFGIATGIQEDHTSVMRDAQIGTVNYMSPEAIAGTMGDGACLKVGPASDVWSLGCILYLMVYGKTPFQHMPVLQKLQRIPDAKHAIEFEPLANRDLLAALQACLQRNPKKRPTIEQLLAHPFLHPGTAAGPALQTPRRDRSHSRLGGAVPYAELDGESTATVTQAQLMQLLSQVRQLDVQCSPGRLSRRIFRQLQQGVTMESLNVAATPARPRAGPTGAAPLRTPLGKLDGNSMRPNTGMKRGKVKLQTASPLVLGAYTTTLGQSGLREQTKTRPIEKDYALCLHLEPTNRFTYRYPNCRPNCSNDPTILVCSTVPHPTFSSSRALALSTLHTLALALYLSRSLSLSLNNNNKNNENTIMHTTLY
ncbi:uncharacterized protein MONBRDRAFT_25473 [Monosiga brevicollis MX1]|uniref:Protein kinase domain-containing protein n=1 Tax=Monosiga brevicollis TaxID=81824 RepID=A9UZI6_MONBE|nr:uncharacterized protein MONBRDRAFT_25473 [Monosiga brevicollis MX1]EDQ89237.1 predicted protein [Monosiga brevicollis MX1]|eukprot:XP_001745813.1 hypothetical protein [Monosiga brevicollis MX1]